MSVAVKELKRVLNSRQSNVYFDPEIELSEKLKSIRCQGLVQIIAVVSSASVIKQTSPDNNVAYIVMELCSGDLRGYLRELKTRVDQLQGITIMR